MAHGDGAARAAQAGDCIVIQACLTPPAVRPTIRNTSASSPRQRPSVRAVDEAAFAISRCLKRPAQEPSHTGEVTSRGGPILSTRLLRRPRRGGDQLAPPGASNSNLNIAKLYLPHQHMPTGRLPGFHQSHFRPFVSLPVKRQTHEIKRRWRRSSFDCGGPERRASPRRLKLPPPGQDTEPPMRLADWEFLQRQSSTRATIAFGCAAKAATGPARPELGFLGRFEKRSRRRLAPCKRFRPFAQSVLLAPTPCLAREISPIRHEALFHGKRVVARRPLLKLASSLSASRAVVTAVTTVTWGIIHI
jgi:hypothetical protein